MVYGDGYIPAPIYIGIGTRERDMIHSNTSVHIRRNSTDEEWWQSLKSTLVILDKVAPHVSDWVRKQKSEGRIVFESELNQTYARYDYIDNTLIINYFTMMETDGRKASILAHEWRHSRQNWCKWIKSLVSCIILSNKNENILETDAYLYEAEVSLAFYPCIIMPQQTDWYYPEWFYLLKLVKMDLIFRRTYLKTLKILRKKTELVQMDDGLSVLAVAIAEDDDLNNNQVIPALLGDPINVNVHDFVKDYYYAYCYSYFDIGSIPVNYKLCIKGVHNWMVDIPLPLNVIMRYLTEHQIKEFENWKNSLGTKKLVIETIQVINVY